MRAFLVYIDDWLSSTKISCMDAHEERGYFRLLLHEYTQPDCGLPDDDKVLAVWSKLGPQWWRETKEKALRINGMTSGAKLRACFELRGTRLFNERLYREWLHQQEVREERSRAGKLGGRPPGKQKVLSQESNSLTNEKQTAKQNETNDVWVCGSASSDSEVKPSSQEKPPPRARENFPRREIESTEQDTLVRDCKVQVWDRYPGVKTEDDYRLVISMCETRERLTLMVASLDGWLTSGRWDPANPRYIPRMRTWLIGDGSGRGPECWTVPPKIGQVRAEGNYSEAERLKRL